MRERAEDQVHLPDRLLVLVAVAVVDPVGDTTLRMERPVVVPVG